jgi:16S rRNA processing protein RimM
LNNLSSRPEAASVLPEDAIIVARIVDAWGIKGWIKVQPFAKDPQALFATTRWFLKAPEGSSVQLRRYALAEHHSMLMVVDARRHGDFVVAHVRDVFDRNGAEALIGCSVLVPRSSFPAPAFDEYYWVDLIGMTVVNRQGESLGDVTGLIDAGPHSLLQVHSPDADERLIPFVAAYVDDVSHASRLIRVDWSLDY